MTPVLPTGAEFSGGPALAAYDRPAMLPPHAASRFESLRDACDAARGEALAVARRLSAAPVVLEIDALPALAGPDSVSAWLRALTYCDRACVGYIAQEHAYGLEPRAQELLDNVGEMKAALMALLGALVAARWP